MAFSTAKSLITIAVIAAIFDLAVATNHTVGKPGGSWDLSTNLSSWASSIAFKSGDNLIFSYSSALHNVVEVNKTSHAACSTTGAIKTYNSGDDVILLSSAGKRYFICGVPGHCQSGMKLEIDTISAATAPSPASGAAPPPRITPSASPQPSPSVPSSGSPPPFGSHPLIPAPESPKVEGPTPSTSSTQAPSAAGRLSLGAAGVTSLGMLIICVL